MREEILCPECKKSVTAGVPQGLCPACLMSVADPNSPSLEKDEMMEDCQTLPPQTPPRPGEETVAPPEGGFSTQPASAPPGAGSVQIPGYEILGELGRGGMGVVYKARHIALRRTVALKMILGGGHAGGAELERFRTEAESIARLQHPNIVQIHEVGEHDGLPFFSLEFCSGGGLDRKLAGTPLPPREAAALVEKLAHAMQAAHDKGVIHRDLKPANVLLAEDGTPKITDFGLAKKLDEAGRTQDGSVMGTPSYMAPEQAGGKSKELGPACDIYALGAILYELLTGRPPFKAATPLDTVLQVVTDDPVPPSQLQNKMPIDVETICLKCLQKEPARRYASALDLAEDLRRYQDGEPIHARPVGSAERVTKWVKRRPMVAGLLAAVALFAFIAFAGIAGGMGWALIERENAIDQEKKTSLALKDTEKAQKKAEEEKTIAEKAREEAVAATKEMKKQLRRAETLVVQVKFDHAFYQSEEKRALSMLSTATLLHEPIVREDQSLRDSLSLHLGNWSGQVHRLKSMVSHKFQVVVNFPGGQSTQRAVVAFSPDGKTVMTGSGDFKEKRGEGRMWETATGKPLGPALLHQGEVMAVAFSPDGRTVMTGSRDNTARLWELNTGKPLGPPLLHQAEVVAVAFSPDSKTVLTGSWDTTARLWEVTTGKPIGLPLQHQGAIQQVAFSPDGKTILTWTLDKAALWETATGKPIGLPQGVISQVFSPDGKTVLTWSLDKTARLWETATGKPLGPPLQHQDQVRHIAFSPDGKTVLTASDKTARLWDTVTSTPLGPPLQHQASVRDVAFSPDGKSVLTGSDDKTARLWETATGQPLGSPLQHQDGVFHVAFSPDGKTVRTGSGNMVRFWETAAEKPFGPPLQHQGEVRAVAFSPDGKTVLTGSTDKTARLWEAATGKQLGPPLQHQHTVMGVAFSPDGKIVLTGSADKTARLWAMGTSKPLGPPLQHQHTVVAVAFSPDGKTALTGSFDKTARLWETATGEPLGQPLQHKHWVTAVAFSPDGKTVLTGTGPEKGGEEGTAHLWETATGKPLGLPLQHQSFVQTVAFSPDGKTVLTASAKLTLLWEAATGKPLGPPLQHPSHVQAMAVSPDGNTILTTSGNTAWLWEAATGKPVGPVLPHQGEVVALAFSPEGKIVLTGSFDKTARLWERSTGKPLGLPLQHQDAVVAVTFSPDGKSVLTGNLDKTARLWRVPRPTEGDPERILLWTQVITGTELDEQGQIRVLDADTWHARRQQLAKLGGPLVP